MRPVQIVAVVALLGFSGAVLANRCPTEMKAIDAKLATNPTLSADNMTKVKKLRADADTAHKAGKHADAEKAVDEAKKILGI